MTDSRIPMGWFDLVHDCRLAIMRDHPSVRVTEMTADRGWLHVRVDDSNLDPAARLRLHRVLQGYVTQSLTTCMCCGSGYGRDRGARKEITCDECEMENLNADA